MDGPQGLQPQQIFSVLLFQIRLILIYNGRELGFEHLRIGSWLHPDEGVHILAPPALPISFRRLLKSPVKGFVRKQNLKFQMRIEWQVFENARHSNQLVVVIIILQAQRLPYGVLCSKV